MSDAVFLLSAAKRASERGDRAGAERLLRSIIGKEPAHLGASRALGELLVDSFRFREAMDAVAAAGRANPMDRELRVLSGLCLYGMGRIGEAHGVLRSEVDRDAASVRGRIGLALCLTAMLRGSEAFAILLPMLKARAGDRWVQFALGRTYLQAGRGAEAAAHLGAAVKSWPNPHIIGELAWALYNEGRHDEARVEFERAHAMDPDIPIVIAGLGAMLIDRRLHDEARELLAGAIARFPADAQILAMLVRTARSPEQRAAARTVAERAIGVTQQASARVSCLYSLGSLKEADGDFDGAFACFREANEASADAFDAAAVERLTRSILEVFTREQLERLPRGPVDPLPVFILGMPRSGTSLIEQILASHPEVFGGGELPDLPRIATSIPSRFGLPGAASFPSCVAGLPAGQVQELASAYLQRLRLLGGAAQRVTDKLPRNYLFCGLIDVLFPGAKIIHCVRDPLDTCVSIYTTALGPGYSYKSRLRDLAAVYANYRRTMDHWKSVLRVPILDVKYEDVIREPEREARRFVEFVGLDWDERCLSFYENRRPVGTASVDQVRRPIYSTSVARWKRYEKHLAELIEGLREFL